MASAAQRAADLLPSLEALLSDDDPELTGDERERLTALLRAPMEQLLHGIQMALGALDGPDPEVALRYAFDAGLSFRAQIADALN